MPYIPIRGFAPDAEATTPGIIRGGSNVVPTVRGMAGAPSPLNTDLPDLTATAVGAISLKQLDGSIRTFAGTATQLYEAGSQAWTDRTRSAGGTYTAGTSWRFAQLGNQSFATNDSAVIQETTSGDFADLSGAPVCSIIEAVNNQLFAFDTNEGTFGDQADRWWASAYLDAASWSPSIASQAVTGRLIDTPGPIRAGRRLFNDVVVYKEKSLYLGQYVGAPEIWRFTLLSDEVGAISQEAVVPLESVHIFMGIDDFYLFDGARPQSIGGDIREFFFNEELDADNRGMVRGAFNRERGRIAYAYPSQDGGGKLDKVIYFHVRTGRWGIPIPLETQTLFELVRATGPTYDALGSYFTTYADIPVLPYDDPYWSSQVTKIAVFNTSNKLQTIDGAAGTWSLRMWDIGQDGANTFMSRARPRFHKYPTTGIQVNAYADNQGQTFTEDAPTATLTDGKFDFERSARWHRLTQTYTGDGEIVGLDVELEEDGLE